MIIIKYRVVVLFPENNRWYSLYTYKEIQNVLNPMTIKITESEIGAFIKGGSIIPLRSRVRRSSKLGKEEPFCLVIALNNDQRASGNMYIDDEETYNFEKGKYCFKRFVFQENELSIINVHDNYEFNNEIETIIITGLKSEPKEIILFKHNRKTIKTLEFEFSKENQILIIHRFRISLDEKIWRIKLIIE